MVVKIKRVPANEIEEIVGRERHPVLHWGRPDLDKKVFYILHSQECLERNPDLRKCRFSVAMEKGMTNRIKNSYKSVMLTLENGELDGLWL